ncbi:MAG TPA: DUF3052 domain-containing protein [Actinomycetota bacterium]|nr:DUF3052 domain-containing protein [Actinomycetota bacterium]
MPQQLPTPMWKKLGLKEGKRLFVSSAPSRPIRADLGTLLSEFPPVSHPGKADVQLLFTTSRAMLKRQFPARARQLPHDGGLWIAWPKRASRIENDLSFEVVQGIGLDAGLVDNKSCTIDEDWQALRFVYRLRDRPKT